MRSTETFRRLQTTYSYLLRKALTLQQTRKKEVLNSAEIKVRGDRRL